MKSCNYRIGLVLFAGLMSGLTVGYLSIDKMDLEIKSSIGTPEEKRQVRFKTISLVLGCGYPSDSEKAPLLTSYSIACKCICHGSSSYIP